MASSATRTVHLHRAQPGTFTRRREVNHDSTSRWRKRLMILSKVLATSVLFVVISSLSVIGAYLNHVRGDGADVTGTYWYHHIMSRLVFAIPTAAVMVSAACMQTPFRGYSIDRALGTYVFNTVVKGGIRHGSIIHVEKWTGIQYTICPPPHPRLGFRATQTICSLK